MKWTIVDEMNEMEYGLKGNQMKHEQWNEWDGVWTEGNAMKHEQWSLYCNIALLH